MPFLQRQELARNAPSTAGPAWIPDGGDLRWRATRGSKPPRLPWRLHAAKPLVLPPARSRAMAHDDQSHQKWLAWAFKQTETEKIKTA
jgi:hypothetical protein